MSDTTAEEEHIAGFDGNKEDSSVTGNEYSPNSEKQSTDKTKNPETELTDMEIFHPHKIHHNRKIKDYIFEFIMLFLAITGGFFMENKREQMVERHKEREYIVSMIRDVQQDTATIQNIIKRNNTHLIGLDSLLDMLERPYPEMDIEKLYGLTIKYMNNYNGFTPHDITMIQLKNSGELRLIENKPVSDRIVSYYSTIEHFHELNVNMNYRSIDDSYKLELSLFDFSPFRVKNKKFTISDPSKLRELYNRATGFRSSIGWDNNWMTKVNEQGLSLLKYLKEEYRIK